MSGVHRIVESHAATRGGQVALVGHDGTLTYRDLNLRANALARFLISKGLRRGSRVVVKMDRCPDLAVVLLAVLKAGGAYTWLEPGGHDEWPYGIALADGITGDAAPIIGIREAIDASARSAPNLPILTRAEDIACVLPERNGLPGILVPHGTIAAMQAHPLSGAGNWSPEPGALDLWVPLMAGGTVTLGGAQTQAAA
jgi:hypothetical protein